MAHDLIFGKTIRNWATGPSPTGDEILKSQKETRDQLEAQLKQHDTWLDHHPFILPGLGFLIAWVWLNRKEKHLF